MRLRLNQSTRTLRWFWSIVFGFVGVAIVVFVFFYPPRSDSLTSLNIDQPLSVSEPDAPPFLTPTEVSEVAVMTELSVPRLDFPPDSVEDACGLNEYIPYNFDDLDNEYHWPKSPYDVNGKLVALESENCRSALEKHINTINPYLWGATDAGRLEGKTGRWLGQNFAFVLLDEPLTFERIFADPTGDLLQIQGALSRPDCLLEENKTNWKLKETCHAEAFLNYALINRFCFATFSTEHSLDDKVVRLSSDGVSRRKRTYYLKDPTPEQDRSMWKQELEGAWVREKCEKLDSTLKLIEHHSDLYELVISLRNPSKPWSKRLEQDIDSNVKNAWATEVLIELAARYGDDAAGLTQPNFDADGWYRETGYIYGRFAWLLTSEEWQEFIWKSQPATDRFLKTFIMLARVGARRPDPRDEIELDWELVARHLCEPPFYESESYSSEDQENPEYKSCKEIVHELRQRDDLKFAPLFQALDKFEQVALELEVYE